MGLSFFEKQYYSERISNNLNKLKELTPCECFIPIEQVAYRFKLDNDDMYIEFPFDEKIEQQNLDLNNHHEFRELDDRIFNYLTNREECCLNYILYLYEYQNDGKPVIKYMETSVDENNINGNENILRNAFRIIHTNASPVGKYRYQDDVNYLPENIKGKQYEKLLFLVEEFEIDSALTKEKKLSYLNITLKLGENDDLKDSKTKKIIQRNIYDLTLFGETLLNKPLSDEIKGQEFKRIFTKKIEIHRHSINNLINSFQHKLPELTDHQLQYGIEFVIQLTKDIITEKQDKEKAWDGFPENPYDILNKIERFFKSIQRKRYRPIFNYSGNCIIELSSLQKGAFFTVLYNIIHNSNKATKEDTYNGDKQYFVQIEAVKNRVMIEIITPALMQHAYTQFINNEILMEDSGLRENGGIAISKRLCDNNGWKFICLNNKEKRTNTVFFEINQ